jgi:hypothetical protein
MWVRELPKRTEKNIMLWAFEDFNGIYYYVNRLEELNTLLILLTKSFDLLALSWCSESTNICEFLYEYSSNQSE